MGQARESSLLFSLQSLLDVERERIDRDRAEQEQRLLEERRRKELAEQRAREAERARVQEQQRREAERLQRAREEAARLEAIRLAEIERVRLEALHRSEVEIAARRHEHEQRLAALAQSSGRKRARIWLGLVAATGVAGAVAVAVYFKQFEGENRTLTARYQQLLAEADAQVAAASGQIEDANRRSQELEREREALRRAREAEPKKTPEKVTPKAPTNKIKAPLGERKSCDPDDPMAGCLP